MHTKITLYLRDGVLDFGMMFFCFGKKFRSGVIIGGIKGIRLVCFFRKLTAGEKHLFFPPNFQNDLKIKMSQSQEYHPK